MTADQPGSAHQPSDPLAADMDAMVQAELGVDARSTVGGPAALVDLADLRQQRLVGDGPS
jgi:hypothetical protein